MSGLISSGLGSTGLTGLPGLAASLVLAWGPNDAWLGRAVDRSDALERELVPVAALVERAAPLWLVAHDRTALDPLYVSATAWDGTAVRAARAWLGGAERLVPELRVPRLFLAAERYPLAALDLESMAVDVFEPLASALVEAQLDRRIAEDPAFAEAAGLRAAATMDDVPPEHRRAAFLSAATDYVAQVSTIAHEIARQQRRRIDRGDAGLCALLEHPATLFGHWRRTLREAEFPGYAPIEAEVEAENAASEAASPSPSPWIAGRTRLTRSVLSPDDKRWIAETLLGVDWTGDPTRDFASLCARP